MDEQRVVVEGAVLIAEAARAGWVVESQFCAPGAAPVPGVGGEVHHLAAGVIERVATTETPQPVIAIVEWVEPDPELLDTADFVVVADGVADPGNLGTMLRSAEAAGAQVVVLTPGTVDVRNPKVVRSSAGSVFRIPVVCDLGLAEVKSPRRRVWGTSSHHGTAYAEVDWSEPVAIVMGNEARGLRHDAPVDEWVTIRHEGSAESLNVAMATTVICFEVNRQRRQATGTVRCR